MKIRHNAYKQNGCHQQRSGYGPDNENPRWVHGTSFSGESEVDGNFTLEIVICAPFCNFSKLLFATTLRKVVQAANGALGVDGVVISPTGLSMNADALFEACGRYRAASQYP